MTEEPQEPQEPAFETPEEEQPAKKGWSRWQIVFCVVAGLLVMAGVVGLFLEKGEPTGAGGGSLPGGASGLAPGSGGEGTQAGEPKTVWSPAIMTMGFSFFVGLAMGYAIRTFFKIAVLFIGLLLLALFGLHEAGIVTVNFDKMDELFKGMTSELGNQFESLKTLITGSLPKASLGILGLYTGLRRG